MVASLLPVLKSANPHVTNEHTDRRSSAAGDVTYTMKTDEVTRTKSYGLYRGPCTYM